MTTTLALMVLTLVRLLLPLALLLLISSLLSDGRSTSEA